jgi:hypothetical protein
MFCDIDPRFLQNIRELIDEAASSFLPELVGQSIKRSYIAVDGASQHVIGRSFSFSGRAEQLTSATRTYECRNGLVSHRGAL